MIKTRRPSAAQLEAKKALVAKIQTDFIRTRGLSRSAARQATLWND